MVYKWVVFYKAAEDCGYVFQTQENPPFRWMLQKGTHAGFAIKGWYENKAVAVDALSKMRRSNEQIEEENSDTRSDVQREREEGQAQS